MPGYRVLWSVGLALGLSGCAATGQSRVAESPGREGLTAKLFAWRHRQAGEPVKKVGAKPEKGPEPTSAVATAAPQEPSDSPWGAPKDPIAGRLTRYFPLLDRVAGAPAKADTARPAAPDIWADSARLALARRDRDRDTTDTVARRTVAEPSVLPVSLEVGTAGTTVRPRPDAPAPQRPTWRPGAVDPASVPEGDGATLPELIEADPRQGVERTSAQVITPDPGAAGLAEVLPPPEPVPSPAPEPAPSPAPEPAPAPAGATPALAAPAPEAAAAPGPSPEEHAPPAPPPVDVTTANPSKQAPGPRQVAAAGPSRGQGATPLRLSMPPLPTKQMPGPVYAAAPPPSAAAARVAAPAPARPAVGLAARPSAAPAPARPAVGLAGTPPTASGPSATPIATSAAPGPAFPAAYYVNPGADAARRFAAGPPSPANPAAGPSSPANPAVGPPSPASSAAASATSTTSATAPRPRRITLLARLIARLQGREIPAATTHPADCKCRCHTSGATPSPASSPSTGGAEPRDLAQGGRDVERVAAQRVGEAAER
jgi:hypothetical protein